MKLKHVHVSNFKSISDTFMHDVEDLNVLIGRNNSGKSNILSCVQIYFTAIHQGEVIVNLGRNEGKGLFHNHDDSHHIDISLYLALSLSERDELIGNITSEFPESGTNTSLI